MVRFPPPPQNRTIRFAPPPFANSKAQNKLETISHMFGGGDEVTPPQKD